MQTKTELRLVGITESLAQFRERLINRLIEAFPGYTIDCLLCTPEDASRFVQLIRDELDCPGLNGAVILGSLINIRKRKDCPTGLKGSRARRKRQQELQSAGCSLHLKEFQDLACDCLADMYKSRTIDSVLCYPNEAQGLARYVRRRAGCGMLDDELILSNIMNVRKG